MHPKNTPPPVNESGYCLCGCGERTPIAQRTNASRGQIKGKPTHYLMGHYRKNPAFPPNTSGLCQCGCGGKTKIAKGHAPSRGIYKGMPRRYIAGHQHERVEGPEVNYGGLCLCGCGQQTPIADRTHHRLGYRKGFPIRCMPGHKVIAEDWWELPDYVVDEASGCWNWTGRLSTTGHGMARRFFKSKQPLAHRAMYEERVGPIPRDKILHHTCFNPGCVNPDHLSLVTRSAHNRIHGRKNPSTTKHN